MVGSSINRTPCLFTRLCIKLALDFFVTHSLSMFLAVGVLIYIPVYSASIYLLRHPSVCWSVCLLSFWLSFIFLHPSVHVSTFPGFYLSLIYPSIYLWTCLSISCLSIWMPGRAFVLSSYLVINLSVLAICLIISHMDQSQSIYNI